MDKKTTAGKDRDVKQHIDMRNVVNVCFLCKSKDILRAVGKNYRYVCRACYKCFSCELHLSESEKCLILLDRIYCLRCEPYYKVQRFALAQFGSGPKMLSYL